MAFTITQIAEHIGGIVEGDGSIEISHFVSASAAQKQTKKVLTFAENEEFLKVAETSNAVAILVPNDVPASTNGKTYIRATDVRLAFAYCMQMFYPEPVCKGGIHPTAIVDAGAQVDETAQIGAYTHIGCGARVGAGAIIEDCCQVGENAVVGDNTHIFPRVTLYPRVQIGARVRIHSGTVIGADGFGYVTDKSKGVHVKVPQVGTVIIHDDVEIGANVTIDRGAMDATVIGKGVKIDNLVMIAHNVKVGDGCIIVSQVGVAGSTQIGAYSVLAGQVGVAGHLKIGNQVTVGAKAGVMTDIPDGQTWLGAPAQPHQDAKRIMVSWLALPDALKRLRQVERSLAELKKAKD